MTGGADRGLTEELLESATSWAAGADGILTYFAARAAKLLRDA